IEPLVPDGTIAALASTLACGEFKVETSGRDCPVGHVERKPSGPCGTTVMFSEYACAAEGMLQLLFGTGKSRMEPPMRVGGPKAPVMPSLARVSAMRHGVAG